jgi:hypothetical protein
MSTYPPEPRQPERPPKPGQPPPQPVVPSTPIPHNDFPAIIDEQLEEYERQSRKGWRDK